MGQQAGPLTGNGDDGFQERPPSSGDVLKAASACKHLFFNKFSLISIHLDLQFLQGQDDGAVHLRVGIDGGKLMPFGMGDDLSHLLTGFVRENNMVVRDAVKLAV